MLIAVIGIVSCSKDDQTNEGVNDNAKISNYLKSFYSANYKLGKSVETKANTNSLPFAKTIEFEDLIITEVFVGEDTIARGYVITDKLTNEFLYFIDVDRATYQLISVDIEANDTKLFEDINELDKYLITNEFDIIKIAEDSLTEENLMDRRRFFGSSYSQGPCDPATGTAQLFEDYYVFGIRVKHTPSVDLVTGGDIWEPCGMH
jgi:hypothetical protein